MISGASEKELEIANDRADLLLKINQLQFNWNSLREWLESDNQVCFCNKTRQKGKVFETGFKFGLAVALDKMNKIEGKDK